MNEHEILKEFIEWKNAPRVRMTIGGVSEKDQYYITLLTNYPTEAEKKIGNTPCNYWQVDNLEVARVTLNMINEELDKEVDQNPLDDITLKKYIDIKLKIYVFVFLEKPKAIKQN